MRSTKKNELGRMARRQMEGSPTPSLSLNETAALGTKVHSSAATIIPNPSIEVNISIKFHRLSGFAIECCLKELGVDVISKGKFHRLSGFAIECCNS